MFAVRFTISTSNNIFVNCRKSVTLVTSWQNIERFYVVKITDIGDSKKVLMVELSTIEYCHCAVVCHSRFIMQSLWRRKRVLYVYLRTVLLDLYTCWFIYLLSAPNRPIALIYLCVQYTVKTYGKMAVGFLINVNRNKLAVIGPRGRVCFVCDRFLFSNWQQQ